jgi:hypothetical protein
LKIDDIDHGIVTQQGFDQNIFYVQI